jgi:hypothetical protein
MVRTCGASPVCLVDLVYLVQPTKRDEPNNGLLLLADCFSILLVPYSPTNHYLSLKPVIVHEYLLEAQ